MDMNLIISIVGIAITILLGILGLLIAKTVKNTRNQQKQNVGPGAIGIQSGRDTKIEQ